MNFNDNEKSEDVISCTTGIKVRMTMCDGTRSVWNAGIWDVPCGGNPDGHTEITYLRMYEACD